MPKALQISLKTLTAIAEALFLAYTEEQAAVLVGISRTTLQRLKRSERWSEIQQKRLLFEKPYRYKIANGAVGWQGAAWMLERQYASQLSKPEVQLSIGASQTTNNTLVITAEAAQRLASRASTIDAEVERLVASKANPESQASNGTSPKPNPEASDEPSKPRQRKAKASRGSRARKEASVS